MTKKNKSLPCPCGLGEYISCCQRFISHQALPDTPEQLMRSRYTAFVLNEADYLRYSWHPDHCPSSLMQDESAPTKWLRLEVLNSHLDDPMHGQVEFIAHYKIQGRAQQLHEISRFAQIQTDGVVHWVYVDGDIQD